MLRPKPRLAPVTIAVVPSSGLGSFESSTSPAFGVGYWPSLVQIRLDRRNSSVR